MNCPECGYDKVDWVGRKIICRSSKCPTNTKVKQEPIKQPEKRSKYNNKKTIVDGITFDSKFEAERYQELKLMLRQGLIQDLLLQPKFELQKSFKDNKGVTQRAINYIADFQYTVVLDPYQANINVVEDCKGKLTEVFKIKKKMFLYLYPGYSFKESYKAKRQPRSSSSKRTSKSQNRP